MYSATCATATEHKIDVKQDGSSQVCRKKVTQTVFQLCIHFQTTIKNNI